MLALSAGVYSTYYVVRDEQISEEDVVDVVENIELPKSLEETQKIPLLVSSISGTSSGVIHTKPSDEGNHLVTNGSVALTSDDTEEAIGSLKSVSDRQTGSALPETKESKDNVSETTSKPDASPSEPSSDLEPRSEEGESGESESSNLLSARANKKEEKIKSVGTSDSPDAKPLLERIESSGSNAVLESANQIEKPISGQSSHSDDTVVVNDQISQTTDLHVEQVQDIQVEIESSVSASVVSEENVIVVEGEEFDMHEVFKAMDIANNLSWGSSVAVSRQKLINEINDYETSKKRNSKSELPTEDKEEENVGGSFLGWVSSWFG